MKSSQPLLAAIFFFTHALAQNSTAEEVADPNLKLVNCLNQCQPADTTCRSKCTESANPTTTQIKDGNECTSKCFKNKEVSSDPTKANACVQACRSAPSSQTSNLTSNSSIDGGNATKNISGKSSTNSNKPKAIYFISAAFVGFFVISN